MNTWTMKTSGSNGSASKAWLRALSLTAPIAQNRDRILLKVIQEAASYFGDAPALVSERESLTYSALVARANRYARWALDQHISKGDAVCLLMPNRPEYLAIWLGISSVGGVVALLNTNLTGASLAHSINIVRPKHIIVAAELAERLMAAWAAVEAGPAIWVHGDSRAAFRRVDQEVDTYDEAALTGVSYPAVSIDDHALYIYTSGTTGLPKAANISHGRILQWSYWFAGMMDTRPADRMYNCLPMYHSVGGVQALGALLVAGGSVVIREKFSAGEFWHDIVRWDCTLFQYIGELCRYLLHSAPAPEATAHRIRMACGNGLRPDVWEAFQRRFHIPHIFEFYGTTEGSVSLFNIEGEPGAIGRIPSYLAHRFPVRLVQFDAETGQPLRDQRGFCVACAPNEVGEAVAPLKDASNIANRFEGYAGNHGSEIRILRDVFETGDVWFRSGDLMRKDTRGFFYFVDRVGDTFRWKGENVATSEVSETICTFPGVTHANVYGVRISRTEGRAGMASLVTDKSFDLEAFRDYLTRSLPPYACPIFLRIQKEMETTATFKYTKSHLALQGYDPTAIPEALYFNHPGRNRFVRLDKTLYEHIKAGEIRL